MKHRKAWTPSNRQKWKRITKKKHYRPEPRDIIALPDFGKMFDALQRRTEEVARHWVSGYIANVFGIPLSVLEERREPRERVDWATEGF